MKVILTLVKFKVSCNNYYYIQAQRRISSKAMQSTQPSENVKQKLLKIFLSAVESVQPANLIGNRVRVIGSHLQIDEHRYKLKKPCYMVGFGKAVAGIALAMEESLGAHLQRAVLTVPTGIFNYLNLPREKSRIEFIEGAANNLPDAEALRGANEIKNLAQELEQDDLLLVLISGGGSALLPLPIPPITLEEKQDAIKLLSLGGADITELNCVRKQISLLKGGGLARIAFPARVIALILSDIIGDPLDFIASGPTTPNNDSAEDAIQIAQKYHVYGSLAPSIRQVLEKNAKSRKTNNKANSKMILPINDIELCDGNYCHVDNYIIGNNYIACEAAKQSAQKLGFQSAILSTLISSDVSDLSKVYANLAGKIAGVMEERVSKSDLMEFLKDLHLRASDDAIKDVLSMDFRQSICLIIAGEPTVQVRGRGKGGRSQQLVLAFSLELKNAANVAGVNVSFLSCGTDGIDGPTDAAGAVVDDAARMVDLCRWQNINPHKYLENNDSYTFFTKFNGARSLIRTGHTGTNVMDIHVMLIEPSKVKSNL